jgi:ABC-2 type transport system ATP-binding protein
LVAHLQGEGRTVFYSSHLLHEVEPLADEVAILHEGRVLRQADPEVLRRDVRQFVLAADALPAVRDDLSLLDLQSSEGEVAVVVENASAVRALLDSLQIVFREFALNLDDIFTAYVAGAKTVAGADMAAPVLEESTR